MLRRIIKGSLITGVGIFFLSVFEYSYVIAAGNFLPSVEFGRLNAAMAILAILVALATAGLGTTLAKFTAERPDPEWQSSNITSSLALQIVISALVMAIMVITTLLLRATPLADLVNLMLVLTASFPVLTLAALLPFAFLGLERIASYNSAMVLNVAVRAAVVIPLVGLHAGATGAFFAFPVGSVAATFFCLLGLRHQIRPNRVDIARAKTLLAYSIPVTLSHLLVILFVRADVVVLKILLRDQVNLVVAQYSAPAVLARGVFYLSSAVAVALLPAVSKAGKIPFAALGRLLLTVGGVHVLLIVLAARFDSFVVGSLYPQDLQPLSYLLPFIVLAMGILSLAHIVGTALIAAGKPGATAASFIAGFLVFTVTAAMLVPGPSEWQLGHQALPMSLGAEGVVAALVAGSAVSFGIAIVSLLRFRSKPLVINQWSARDLTSLIDRGR